MTVIEWDEDDTLREIDALVREAYAAGWRLYVDGRPIDGTGEAYKAALMPPEGVTAATFELRWQKAGR